MLSIYVIRVLFIDPLKPLGVFVPPLVWQLVFLAVVFGLSLLVSIINRNDALATCNCLMARFKPSACAMPPSL